MSYTNYIQAINDLLLRYNLDLDPPVTEDDLGFRNPASAKLPVVTDDLTEKRRITARLTRAISPPIPKGEFYHYTSFSAAEEILNTKILRLTSLMKRVAENEIVQFLEDFNLVYPLSNDPETGKPRYSTSIANNIFYTSFTDTSLSEKEEEYFWNCFAGMNGVRLKFRIELYSGCLRRMVYGSDITKWASFFRELNELTERELSKPFFYGDSAIVCALLLPKAYRAEKETRLITYRCCGLPLEKDGGIEFLKLSFGHNEAIGVNLQLVEIQTNQQITNSCGATVVPRS